jgi:hypothetical protein
MMSRRVKMRFARTVGSARKNRKAIEQRMEFGMVSLSLKRAYHALQPPIGNTNVAPQNQINFLIRTIRAWW